MPRPAATERQQRLALANQTVGQLIEWQGRAVALGHRKPSYSHLLDAVVRDASERGADILGRLPHPAPAAP